MFLGKIGGAFAYAFGKATSMSNGKVLVVMSSAHVETIANWHPNVVVDRELITGQQPMSAAAFGDALVAKLNQAVQR